MQTRNPRQYLIEKFKMAGKDSIIPNLSIRFLASFINEMPDSWQGLSRENLVKTVRKHCEIGASLGELKRTRMDGIQGYVYLIQ